MPNPMTALDLEAARALCEKATPGEWHTGPLTGAGHVWVYSRGDPLAEPVNPRDWYGKAKNALYRVRRVWDQRDRPTGNLGCPSWARAEANAAFIAASRTLVPALLDELAQARAALAEIARMADREEPERGYPDNGNYDDANTAGFERGLWCGHSDASRIAAASLASQEHKESEHA